MIRQKLRKWQKEALNCYRESLAQKEKSILWEATPGAGKTTAALLMLSHQLRSGRGEPCLIVVPTSHLKIQWIQAAHKFNIHLASASSPKKISKDFNGMVVTYQQLAHTPHVFKDYTKNSPIILDEIHHAGDGLRWGDALSGALSASRFILCLSGTAFRSDNNAIPFVAYDNEGQSQPHYSYNYRDAVKDGVCRPLVFFSYGGSISWLEENGETVSAKLSDPLDRLTASKRLRAALDPRSGWIDPLINDAHKKLLQVRQTQKNAGGLLVCADKTHARSLEKLLKRITNTKPVVVLSDDARASKKINDFAESSIPWLIACNMVSEGVDIPRLRVGIFATTIRTRMYFRQFLGRIVRRIPKPEGVQLAYCYLPGDNRLSQLAEEIEQEQRHCLNFISDDLFIERDIDSVADRSKEDKYLLEPSASVNSGVESVIVNGEPLPLFDGFQSVVHSHSMDEILEHEVHSRIKEDLSKSEKKELLAKDIKELVGRYHRKSGVPYPSIHSKLNSMQKVRGQALCTIEQLQERAMMLENLISKTSI